MCPKCPPAIRNKQNFKYVASEAQTETKLNTKDANSNLLSKYV